MGAVTAHHGVCTRKVKNPLQNLGEHPVAIMLGLPISRCHEDCAALLSLRTENGGDTHAVGSHQALLKQALTTWKLSKVQRGRL